MSVIKLEFNIDAENVDHLEATILFLKALKGEKEAPRRLEGPTTEEKSKRKRRTKKELTEDTKEETQEEETQEEETQEEETQEEETAITEKDIRRVLAEKINDNMGVIKSKLDELDAPNISSLDKKDYPEFMDFLKNLS